LMTLGATPLNRLNPGGEGEAHVWGRIDLSLHTMAARLALGRAHGSQLHGHTLGWLIKFTVWDQAGVWIGPEVDHDPKFLLRNIGPNKPCWCGSGVKYKKCHRSVAESSVRERP
ncbi:MAG: SEC-C domain-containing protein, partial [Acidobacteriota bacterium]|nr:SEC-C domain-containing protein [Acidobacteriota bacterium]